MTNKVDFDFSERAGCPSGRKVCQLDEGPQKPHAGGAHQVSCLGHMAQQRAKCLDQGVNTCLPLGGDYNNIPDNSSLDLYGNH